MLLTSRSSLSHYLPAVYNMIVYHHTELTLRSDLHITLRRLANTVYYASVMLWSMYMCEITSGYNQ